MTRSKVKHDKNTYQILTNHVYLGESQPSREELKKVLEVKFLQETSTTPDASFPDGAGPGPSAMYQPSGGGPPIHVRPTDGEPGYEVQSTFQTAPADPLKTGMAGKNAHTGAANSGLRVNLASRSAPASAR